MSPTNQAAIFTRHGLVPHTLACCSKYIEHLFSVFQHTPAIAKNWYSSVLNVVLLPGVSHIFVTAKAGDIG